MNSRLHHHLTRTLTLLCLLLSLWMGSPTSANALGGTLPPLNSAAPAFTLPTNTGDGEISLADYSGKWLVLYFYPKDFTSGCTLEARRFRTDYDRYRAINTEIVGVSADSVDSHAEFCAEEKLAFPLLADTNGAVSKAYGSWLGIFSMRHTFIINPTGTIVAEFTGVNPASHSQEVLAKLAELQSA
jgi:thioredoxin-dependent peroxiredoxin